jgi:hypothetical protein
VALAAGMLLFVGLLVAWSEGNAPVADAHHPWRLDARGGDGPIDLPMGYNEYFAASGECHGCHGPDTVNNHANIDPDGNDVNVSDDWRSTMMANSARDPFWRAKVSHEVLVNPAHQVALEDKCTSCHAPMGRFNKQMTGGGPYSMAELHMDTIALDGVSCVACHMQSPEEGLGHHFSGELTYDTLHRLWGPYEFIIGAPMTAFIGYEPLYGPHVAEAALCAGCHTLLTATADINGEHTGDMFVEQATYHEWLNSAYNNVANPESGVTCQGCHVPRIDGPIVISANYLFLEGQSPFGLHHFAGANSFMLKLMRDNSAALGLTASTAQFDSTIARTDRLVQNNALLLDLDVTGRDADTAFIDVALTNLGGHKFPSGYPARRAFVELVVRDADGQERFRSGGWDEEYEVIGHDPDWEPHHDVIADPGQVQIYEMVMGDVNGDKTTILERAKNPLKDNRVPPLGFLASHPAYDTTLVAGVPGTDTDFNRSAQGVEGSGSDVVHYHVPMQGYTGPITVEARVWYQSAPPRWMEEMFSHSTPEIDAFRTMYEAADGTPVLVREAIVTDHTTGIDDLRELGLRIFPNPVRDGRLTIRGITGRVEAIDVFDVRGARVGAWVPTQGGPVWTIDLPRTTGTYVVVVQAGGRRFVERVVAY